MRIKLMRSLYLRSTVLRRFVVIHRPVLLRLRDFKLYVRLDDWSVGMRIVLKRGYESHVTNIMRPLLKPGMVMIDIGANIGFYTMLAAARVGNGGKVLAFEPGEDNCMLLRMSLAANNFKNVIIYEAAVADLDGIVGLHLGGSNGAISRNDPDSLPYQVPSVRLDTVLPDEPRIDMIKMDIEGAEALALAGMEQLIARHRPIIFSEFSPGALKICSGVTPEQFLNRVRSFGYNWHVLHRIGGQNAAPQSNEEIMTDFENYQSDHLDLVAYPQG